MLTGLLLILRSGQYRTSERNVDLRVIGMFVAQVTVLKSTILGLQTHIITWSHKLNINSFFSLSIFISYC